MVRPARNLFGMQNRCVELVDVVPETVMLELVVAGHCDESSPGWSEREEDLEASLRPGLRERKEGMDGGTTQGIPLIPGTMFIMGKNFKIMPCHGNTFLITGPLWGIHGWNQSVTGGFHSKRASNTGLLLAWLCRWKHGRVASDLSWDYLL